MSDFVEIANTIIDREKVACLISDPDERKVTVFLDSGQEIVFRDSEASEVWKAFDKE